MLLRRCSGVFVFAVLAIAGPARSEDRDLAFIHAMQGHKYGDTAAEFLESVKDNPAVKDVWDLEMSKSLRIEAMTSSDPAVKETLLKQAQGFLDKFAQDKPNHPEAIQAKLANAGMVMDQGSEALVLAPDEGFRREEGQACRRGSTLSRPGQCSNLPSRACASG